MRKVIFDKNAILCNIFGVEIPLKQEASSFYAYLPTEQSYVFDDTIFFVAKGFGDIDYKQLPAQKPSFSKIMVENLDFFLQNKTHSAIHYDEIAQIESFINLLEFNNTFSKPKIYTNEYNILLNQLLGMNNERFYKI